MTRYLLVHPEMGIYLGSMMGLGFWTKLDPLGQPEAVTFASEDEARNFIQTWDESPTKYETFAFVPVETETRYATIAQCVAAGLEAWDPEMKPTPENEGGHGGTVDVSSYAKNVYAESAIGPVGSDVQVNAFKTHSGEFKDENIR